MPPRRARHLFAFAALFGLLAAGCAHHRPSPAPGDVTPLPEAAAPLRYVRPATDLDHPPALRQSAPDTPFTRAQPSVPFEPQLVVTTQVAHEDIFVHAVSSPATSASEATGETGPRPRYHRATRLYRGQRAFILTLARNFAFDALETTDLTFELVVQKPDGTTDGPPLSAVLWQDSVPAPEVTLYPLTTVSFYAEPGDPLGEYRILVRARDHLGGDTRELAHTLVLEDYTPPPLPADFDYERWFNSYYLQPTPEFALPALPRFFEKLPADKRTGAIPPLLGFYDQLLRDNPWLLPAFGDRLAAAPPDEAFALCLVLGFHLRTQHSPPAGLSSAAWLRLADFRVHDWPADPDAPLLLASQLDALWGRFFASALREPIERLLEPLTHTADLGAAERWRDALPPPAPRHTDPQPDLEDPATPDGIRREVLLRTALWSLRANARQHPLVRGYLEQSLRAGELSPGARVLLERALRAEPALAGSRPHGG